MDSNNIIPPGNTTISAPLLTAVFAPEGQDQEWVDNLKKGFIGDILACLSITMAVISTPAADGTVVSKHPEPVLEDYTPMPDDFIPQVNVMKAIPDKDPTPVEDRFKHLTTALDKRNKQLRGDKATFPSISMEQFQDRLRALRQATVKWGAARVEEFFVSQIKREYPDLRINDREIDSSADFCDWIKKGPWDNKMRGIVAYASGDMWGMNNQWAINLEVEYCRMLQIRFTGLKSNNKKLQRMHKGRCVAAILVKGKGSLVGKFRNTCKRKYLEAIYCRFEKPKLGGPTEKSDDGKVAVPRMVAQETARLSDHGFNGKLAKCEGHPDLKKAAPTQVVTDMHASPCSTSTTGSTLSSLGSPEGGLEAEIDLDRYGIKSVDELRTLLESMSPGLKKTQDDGTASTSLVSTETAPSKRKPPSAANRADAERAPIPQKDPTTPKRAKVPDGCCHKDGTTLVSYTNAMGYFKSEYLEKQSLWPKKCDNCDLLFVDKPECQLNQTIEYKVCAKSPVFLCKNGADSRHSCVFGLCKECKYEILGASPSRKRKRRIIQD